MIGRRQVERPKCFYNSLEDFFPGWTLIESLGPPGAGKTFLCEQLVGIPNVIASADDRGIRFCADRSQWRATRALLPYFGQKLAKEYYRFSYKSLERRLVHLRGAEGNFLGKAIALVDSVPMSDQYRKVIRRSIMQCTALTVYSRNEGLRLVVDEGSLAGLTNIHRLLKETSAPAKYFDQLRECIELFPFERNALAVTAPPDVCFARQVSRGKILASAQHPQSGFHEAHEAIRTIRGRAGWKILAIDNG